MSINMLEKKAELKKGAIYNVISGMSKNPNIYTIMKVSKVLDCPVSHFFLPIDEEGKIIKPEQNISQEEKNFDSSLYSNCIASIVSVARSREIIVPKKILLKLTEEVYHYCVKSNVKFADRNFVDWIMEKWLSQKNAT